MKKRFKSTQQQPKTELRFSPTAWAKLIFFRDQTENEVGAFGITSADDLLYVEDIAIIKQTVSMVTVAFDDLAVADFFEQQVDWGRKPEQFARIWVHSHPGCSPEPSSTDEDTFRRVFGSCDWSVMFIIAQDGKTYCRLHFNAGPSGDIHIPVYVDYSRPFGASDCKSWKAEYKKHVKQDRLNMKRENEVDLLNYPLNLPDEVIEQFELMDPDERQQYLDELVGHNEFWDEEMEVLYE